MSRFISRRPSPALAVAFVALLAALSGTAVALPGKNSVKKDDIASGAVNSSDIRNNAVTSTDVRNSTLRGRDVRNNSLTGADITGIQGGDVTNESLTGNDINESTLGKVPSAGTADTLQGAGPGTFQPSSKQLRFGPFNLAVGADDRTIGSFGPFTLRAECNAGPDGQMTLTTSENNAYADSDETSDADFDVGDNFNASGGNDEDDEINAASVSGTAITGQLYTVESATALGGGCTFWGEVTTTNG